VSAQAEQARAAIFRWTEVGELLATHKNDVRNRCQRLYVINDRGPTPESNHSREWWPDSGDAALAFQRFHQRGFFSNLIRACAGVPANIKILAAAKDVLT
jgi:hypothetical protein